jgi:hypothetical protein
MVGVALVWAGLSALAYVSGATPSTPVVWTSLLGFAAFAGGAFLFAEGLKLGIVAQLKRELGR